MKTTILGACCITLLIASGCASTPGAKPGDMSAADHEKMARSAELTAGTHTADYDANAKVTDVECTATEGLICWESARNPTASHREDAQRHRKAAADHRAASKALTDAEASSCRGVSGHDRDVSPFHHKENLLRIDSIDSLFAPDQGITRTDGVVIVMKPTAGLTKNQLERIVNCHVARNAAAGYEMPEMSYCPLNVKGTFARVSKVKDGNLAVSIYAPDEKTNLDLVRRSNALLR